MNNKVRGFEVVSKYSDCDVILPKRSTAKSAGYDFFAIEEMSIPPVKETGYSPVLVPTGIKAFMKENECLIMANRSSNPMKKALILTNGIGVIDSDYYNNPSNEGHIKFQFINVSDKPITIHVGDKLGQGIFMPFLLADNDNAQGSRVGGFGSTGK